MEGKAVMAEEHAIIVLDDVEKIEGKRVEGAEPVYFAVEGQEYRVDLVRKNKDELLDILSPFIRAGQPVTRKKGKRSASAELAPKKSSRAAGSGNTDAQHIRDWARAQGMKVADRGRVPNDLIEAYNNAHGS